MHLVGKLELPLDRSDKVEVGRGREDVGSAVQASLRIRKISLTGPFHSLISCASTTQNQPNILSIAYNA
jgi:hypothetical protein